MRFRVIRKTVYTTNSAKVRQFLKKGYRVVSFAYWADNSGSGSWKLEKVA